MAKSKFEIAREAAIALLETKTEEEVRTMAVDLFGTIVDTSVSAPVATGMTLPLMKDGDVVPTAVCLNCGNTWETDGSSTHCTCGQGISAVASKLSLNTRCDFNKIAFIAAYDAVNKVGIVVIAKPTMDIKLNDKLEITEKDVTIYISDMFMVSEEGLFAKHVPRSYWYCSTTWRKDVLELLVSPRKGNYEVVTGEAIDTLKSCDVVSSTEMHNFLKDMSATSIIDFAEDALDARAAAKAAKAAKGPKTVKACPYDGICLKEVTIPDIVDAGVHCECARKVEASTKGTTWRTACICGSAKDIFVPLEGETPLPCTGKSIEDATWRKFDKANMQALVVDYNESEDYYVFRRVRVTHEMDEFFYSSMEIFEDMRIFMDSTGVYAYSREKHEDDFEKTSVTVLDELRQTYSLGDVSLVFLKGEEYMKDTLTKSFMKYSGLREAWGLKEGVGKMDEPWNISRSSYWYMWYQRPAMEQVMKCGLYQATHNMLRSTIKDYPTIVNPKGKTVTDILGITKPVFKIACDMDLSIPEIRKLQEMWEADNTLDTETYKNILDVCNQTSKKYGYGGYTIDIMFDICKDYNVKFATQVEYAREVQRFQCIPASEAIKVWSDYLRMATKVGIKMRHARKYPKSLRLEHDKCVYITNSLSADETDRTAFAEAAKKNEWLSWKYKHLLVINPTTPEQVVDEGIQQSHCISTYVEMIKECKTAVLFIRHKDTPDEPFYALEVKDGAITEVKGFSNSVPTEPEVLELLKEYMKVKKLRKETTDF